MNKEIMDKIADAIKNNDMVMIKKLEEEYNVKINLGTSLMNKVDVDNMSSFNKDGFSNARLVSMKKIDSKDLVDTVNNNYFRDIPCDNDLFIIYFLASNHKLLVQESDIFGAFLLRWIKEDKISYAIKKKGLFKKKYSVFMFKDNIVIEDELERKIYNLIKNISRDNVLDVKEFNDWLDNRAFEFNSFLNELKSCSHDRMIKAGLLIPVSNLNHQNSGMEMSTSQHIMNEHNRNIFVNNANLNINGNSQKTIVKTNVVSEQFHLMPKYREYLQQIADFKKFIKEFSLMHEKEVLEIKLWGDYLAVSQLLGLASDISKQLNNLIPGFRTASISKKSKVKIKVPRNIPKNEIEKYINDEMNKRKDNMFKF